MTKKLRWGILSTARINRRIIPPIQEAGRSEVVAVASRSLDKAQAFAAQWAIPKAFGSYEALLASPDVDAIYISLPNNMHHEWTVKAANAGKHVLCEKPLALSVADVDAMAQAGEANNVVIFEALMYQMHPQLAKLKALLTEGLIGKIQLIKAHFSITLPDNSGNFRLKPGMGAGSVWDVGSYPISFANSIMGVAPHSVMAYQQTNKDGIETVLTGQMHYAGGTIAQFDSSFRMPYRIGAEVIGETGVIRIPQPWQPNTDQRGSGLIHIAADDTETVIETEAISPYLCQIAVMEKAVFDRVPPSFSLAQSRVNIATIQALYQAAEQGRLVTLNL